METSKEYSEFLDKLLIEELIKEFDFDCELTYVGKKRFGGSNITTYYFKDEFGITFSRDVGDRSYWSIVERSPKLRPRITD